MKGQVSMEYLFIYIFALGVVLSSIATFNYLNIGNVDDSIPSTCSFEVGITCEDSVVFQDGTVKIQFKNSAEEIYDPYLECTYPNGKINTGNLNSGKIDVGTVFNMTCDPYGAAELQTGKKVRIKTILYYHKNVTTFKNYRTYDGSVVSNVR